MNRRLPTLKDTKISDSELSMRIFIPKDIEYFEGHFEGFHLLPGVVQIAWVVEFAKSYLKLDGRLKFKGLENVKFVRPIFPETEVELNIKFESVKKVLSFEYKNSETRLSLGKLKFELPNEF